MLAADTEGFTDLAMQGAAGRYQGDETLLVKFFLHPRLHPQKSSEAERPIYIDTPYISIMQPGNKDSIVMRPATAMDRNRFAEHWKKFQARTDDTEDEVIGTPLSEWAGVSKAQVEELRYLNIRSVEQLATMSDSNTQGIMGINGLKSKAANYLESAKESETRDALAAANARIDELMAMMGEKDAPKKRTRRTKAQMEADNGLGSTEEKEEVKAEEG